MNTEQTNQDSATPPKGPWTVERTVSLLAGSLVLGSLLAGRSRPRARLVTAFVGTNLVMAGTVGWCPSSLILHKLGLPWAASCGLKQRQA